MSVMKPNSNPNEGIKGHSKCKHRTSIDYSNTLPWGPNTVELGLANAVKGKPRGLYTLYNLYTLYTLYNLYTLYTL